MISRCHICPRFQEQSDHIKSLGTASILEGRPAHLKKRLKWPPICISSPYFEFQYLLPNSGAARPLQDDPSHKNGTVVSRKTNRKEIKPKCSVQFWDSQSCCIRYWLHKRTEVTSLGGHPWRRPNLMPSIHPQGKLNEQLTKHQH
jgi:hypothetical protein